MPDQNPPHLAALRRDLDRVARELGFAALGVADIDLGVDEARLGAWLEAGLHGEMEYMQRHGTRRSRPQELVPGTLRVISVRMDYWPADAAPADAVLADPSLAYVSRYALGRDYHKVMRRALEALAQRIAGQVGPFGYRVFVDSAPVLEKPLARNAGLGWIGKHTNLIARDAGSWFFLGELYTDLPLPVDAPASAHCGSCEACLPACPTAAIVAPGRLDARRCISYLTIELKGTDPGGIAAPARQSHLRLRRLPAGVPVEQLRAGGGAPGLQGAPRTGCAAPRDAVLLDARAVRGPDRRFGDPSHRPRTLAAQHRGGARQCADERRGAARARSSTPRTTRRWCANTCTGRCSVIAP